MKLLTILSVFLATLLQPCNAEDRETELYQALGEIVDATFDYEFEKLAERMHPRSLQHFRQVMAVRFDQLAELREPQEVLGVIGLRNPPDKSPLSNKELFVTLANRAMELDPGFVGPPDLLPIDVHGAVFSRNEEAFVVYEYSGEYSSKKRTVGYLQPRTISFKHDGNRWLLYSTCFSRSIPRVWAAKLLESDMQPKTGE